MKPEDRPPSPRFLQTDVTNVFTDVIKTMSDQRNIVKWNRDVFKKEETDGVRTNNTPKLSTPKIEVTRLASGLNSQSPLQKINFMKKTNPKKRADRFFSP